MKYLLALLFLLGQPAWADWTIIAQTADGDKKLFVDFSTIQKDGNFIKVWQLTNFSTPPIGYSVSILSVLSNYEFDCKNEKVRKLSITGFSELFARGKALVTEDKTENWVDIPPQSIISETKQKTCKVPVIASSNSFSKNARDVCLKESDAKIAALACTEALKLNSRDPALYHYRGNALSEAKEYQKAIDDYSKSIELNPSEAASYYGRGLTWQRLKESQKAISDYTEAIRKSPKWISPYFNRGLVFLEIVNTDDALADFNTVINLDSKKADGYSGRASAWRQKKNYEASIKDYTESIKLDSSNAIYYNDRGTVWSDIQNYEQAILDYTRAINISESTGDKKVFIPYHNRGEAWSKKQNFDKAIADYSEAIKINPNSESFVDRGLAWKGKNELDSAISDFKEAIRLNPNAEDAKEQLQLAVARKDKLLQSVGKVFLANPDTNKATKINKRVALVIGNGKYRMVNELENPVRDAQLIASTLKKMGFDSVSVHGDLNRQQMMSVLNDFETIAKNADWAAIYFAGHGIEIGGVNYMVPIDAQPPMNMLSVSTQYINLEYFLKSVEVAKKMKLVILDACRDNPLAEKMRINSISRGLEGVQTLSSGSRIGVGLGRVEPQPGTLVVYATKHGSVAMDGDGQNSPFAEALVKRIIQKPSLEVRRLFDFVREDVFGSTNKQQQPFAYGSLSASDDFYFSR